MRYYADASTMRLAGESTRGPDANPRSLANFPMQANGAEMLRLAWLQGHGAWNTQCPSA